MHLFSVGGTSTYRLFWLFWIVVAFVLISIEFRLCVALPGGNIYSLYGTVFTFGARKILWNFQWTWGTLKNHAPSEKHDAKEILATGYFRPGRFVISHRWISNTDPLRRFATAAATATASHSSPSVTGRLLSPRNLFTIPQASVSRSTPHNRGSRVSSIIHSQAVRHRGKRAREQGTDIQSNRHPRTGV